MSYKFKLQKLLDIREEKEEGKKREFVQAMTSQNLVEKKIKEFKTDYNQYKNVPLNVSTIERKVILKYLNTLNMAIETEEKELKKRKVATENKRKELVQAQVERKTVEILKEKDYKRFKDEESMKEQKQADEFALYGHIRKVAERR
ncbi:flagellar export protein FliJ [Clostridium senegalense]